MLAGDVAELKRARRVKATPVPARQLGSNITGDINIIYLANRIMYMHSRICMVLAPPFYVIGKQQLQHKLSSQLV
jgi:hypothetical protein